MADVSVDGRGEVAGVAGGPPHPDPPAVQGPRQAGERALLPLHLLQGSRIARLDRNLCHTAMSFLIQIII